MGEKDIKEERSKHVDKKGKTFLVLSMNAGIQSQPGFTGYHSAPTGFHWVPPNRV